VGKLALVAVQLQPIISASKHPTLLLLRYFIHHPFPPFSPQTGPHTQSMSLLYPRLILRVSAQPIITTSFLRKPNFNLQTPFSTSPPSRMNEYLVTIPDHPNSLDKRLAARPKHLANLKPHIDSGKVVFGGAMLSRHPEDGEGADMTVS
jgi:hypothetical protein